MRKSLLKLMQTVVATVTPVSAITTVVGIRNNDICNKPFANKIYRAFVVGKIYKFDSFCHTYKKNRYGFTFFV